MHSLLHEAGHLMLMPPEQRAAVHTDAGDTQRDEDAVCYLQLLLADALPGFGRERAFADMDAWGYSFRLGSARAWFEHDAEDARDYLHARAHLAGLLPPPCAASPQTQSSRAETARQRATSASPAGSAESSGESRPATPAWNISERKACIDEALPRCAG